MPWVLSSHRMARNTVNQCAEPQNEVKKGFGTSHSWHGDGSLGSRGRSRGLRRLRGSDAKSERWLSPQLSVMIASPANRYNHAPRETRPRIIQTIYQSSEVRWWKCLEVSLSHAHQLRSSSINLALTIQIEGASLRAWF